METTAGSSSGCRGLASRSVRQRFGKELVSLFYEEYGLEEVDCSRLDFFTDLADFFKCSTC